MDSLFLIVTAMAIVMFIMAVSRAVNNLGRIEVRAEGLREDEISRMLREAQKEEREVRDQLAKPEQNRPVRPEDEPYSRPPLEAGW